jgi:hypothetical protein
MTLPTSFLIKIPIFWKEISDACPDSHVVCGISEYLAIVTRKTLSASAARLASGCAPFVALVLASLPHLSGTSKLDERVCA